MLVFSSVDSTQSEESRGIPSQRPAYRSRTRPAFSSKAGSRGNSQLRWYQGRMASSLNHRQRVVSPIDATSPRSTTSRRISEIAQPREWKAKLAGQLAGEG